VKALVVYDSQYGNTEKIAQVIAESLGGPEGGVRLSRVNAIPAGEVTGLDILIVGSPTQRWNTTEATTRFLESIPQNALTEVRSAAFDTRLRARLGGAAALKIERMLRQSGSRIIAPAGAFYVTEKTGPLAKGELERAAEWARRLISKS
jgi:menaquinone-dependent protoporphyrinogen IX oxidase